MPELKLFPTIAATIGRTSHVPKCGSGFPWIVVIGIAGMDPGSFHAADLRRPPGRLSACDAGIACFRDRDLPCGNGVSAEEERPIK